MIIKTSILKKLPSGQFRLYSKKKGPDGKRRNLGTFDSLSAAKKHESEVQFFKHQNNDGMADDHETKTLGRLSHIATYLDEAGFIDGADKIYKAMDCIDPNLQEDCIIDQNCNRIDRQVNIDGGYSGGTSGFPGQGFGGDQAGCQGYGGDDPNQAIGKLVDIANRLDKLGMFDGADKVDLLLSKIALIPEQPAKQLDMRRTTKGTTYTGLDLLVWLIQNGLMDETRKVIDKIDTSSNSDLLALFGPGIKKKPARKQKLKDPDSKTDKADDMPHIINDLERHQQVKETEDTHEQKEDEKQGNEAVARSNGKDISPMVDGPGCGGLSDAYFFRSYTNLEGTYGQNI